jgi:adenylosuccinate synthase
MTVDVLLGLQWGDEGKGKVVDVLTPDYDIVARFQGGPNAGHTIKFGGQECVLRSIPSGIFQGSLNVIGSGCVIDPILLWNEVKELEGKGIIWEELLKKLVISQKVHLILPTHRLLDVAYETAKGGGKIGTTGKGIGPAYTDKISRNGLRLGDAQQWDKFQQKYSDAKKRHEEILRGLNYSYDIEEFEQLENDWFQKLNCIIDYLRIEDTEYLLNNELKKGKKILAEGAQGTLLDISYGSYPYVTSSNTIASGACTGLGVAPSKIGEVYGIFKAYCTRVGEGPFPTELSDETGEEIGRRGAEFGAVTRRKRRCGWIDLVALKYAIMLNGVSKLIMMKSDVLDIFAIIKACVAYEINGERTEQLPFDIAEANIEPIYAELPGWETDMTAIKSEDEFPKNFENYILFLEHELGVPILIVSVGPDREQTIQR